MHDKNAEEDVFPGGDQHIVDSDVDELSMVELKKGLWSVALRHDSPTLDLDEKESIFEAKNLIDTAILPEATNLCGSS